MHTALIIGGTGMIGSGIYRAFKNTPSIRVRTTIRGTLAASTTRDFFDPTDVFEGIDFEKDGFERFRNIIRELQPEVAINATGLVKQITAPDSKFVFLNAYLPHRLHDIIREESPSTYLITISTDCVFDGATGGYTESSRPTSLDAYGASKRLGEVTRDNALTIRTSTYGLELGATPHGVLAWFLAAPQEVRGFTQAFFSGVSTPQLGASLAALVQSNDRPTGIYHLHSDRISKYELLRLFDHYFKTRKTIVPDDSLHIDRSLLSEHKPLFSVASHDEMVQALASAASSSDSAAATA